MSDDNKPTRDFIKDFQHWIASTSYNGDKHDKELCAYYYNDLGLHSYGLKIFNELGINNAIIDSNCRAHMDSSFIPIDDSSEVAHFLYPYQNVTNCKVLDVDEVEVVFPGYETPGRESGLFIQTLPYIEALKKINPDLKVYMQCSDRVSVLFDKYFEYIQTGQHSNKIHCYDLFKAVKERGGPSLLRPAVLNISRRISPHPESQYIGINWYANDIRNQSRSIPIGTLINSVGNHKLDLNIKSLQYNNIETDIDVFNKYSKNKIISKVDSNIDTTIVEIIESLKDCYCFVGIQSEAAVIAYSLLGIPTIVTASTPHMYWYFHNSMNPFLNTVRMRFNGDYEYVNRRIHRLL